MSDERESTGGQPPRPRYGEYAPGYTPGAASEPGAAAPQPSGSDAPATPPAPAGQPAWAPPPVPQYAAAPQWTATGTTRPRRTWDLVLTIVLLVMAVLGTLFALLYAAILSDPSTLDQAFRQQGLGGFDGEVGSAPAVIAISHIALLILAVALSIAGLVRRRITFWIPLAIGVVAAIVFWGSLIAVIASDPGLLQRYAG